MKEITLDGEELVKIGKLNLVIILPVESERIPTEKLYKCTCDLKKKKSHLHVSQQ